MRSRVLAALLGSAVGAGPRQPVRRGRRAARAIRGGIGTARSPHEKRTGGAAPRRSDAQGDADVPAAALAVAPGAGGQPNGRYLAVAASSVADASVTEVLSRRVRSRHRSGQAAGGQRGEYRGRADRQARAGGHRSRRRVPSRVRLRPCDLCGAADQLWLRHDRAVHDPRDSAPAVYHQAGFSAPAATTRARRSTGQLAATAEEMPRV
jgi:hypothetical protein